MRRSAGFVGLVCLAGVLACEPETADRDAAVRTAPEAAERAPTPPADQGYEPEMLAWLQEGRPVEHDGREWQPVGAPLAEPAASFIPVGEFEGMTLFAVRGEAPPYARLYFPLADGTWQALEPIGSVDDGAADGAAAEADPPGPG